MRQILGGTCRTRIAPSSNSTRESDSASRLLADRDSARLGNLPPEHSGNFCLLLRRYANPEWQSDQPLGYAFPHW